MNQISTDMDPSPKDRPSLHIATLAGGCFWCLEAVFEQLRGVEKIISGYSGGNISQPSYKAVCSGATGHAEAVQITFDPAQITFRDLLDVFFIIHDPTTLNRQGADVGTQYRSAIFYHDDGQREIAQWAMQELASSGVWGKTIVTELVPFTEFYPAEEYHQEYYRRNSYQPYCQVVITPKLAKFRKQYLDRLKV